MCSLWAITSHSDYSCIQTLPLGARTETDLILCIPRDSGGPKAIPCETSLRPILITTPHGKPKYRELSVKILRTQRPVRGKLTAEISQLGQCSGILPHSSTNCRGPCAGAKTRHACRVSGAQPVTCSHEDFKQQLIRISKCDFGVRFPISL